MQYVIVAEHPPQLCPSGNAQIRDIMKRGAQQIPGLAQRLGVNIITMNVYGPEHVVIAVVEAGDIETVRDFAMQSGLAQWNTVKVNATWSLEEALAKIDNIPTIF
ncbi:MAG: hypothetical protein HYS09_08625 [Chloroflexi bacterium]|nr:hypothetical protein [Chloroflexota bacterium]